MKTLVCYSKENIKIKNTNVPVVGRDEVLIRTILCGLCGSDIVKIISPDVKKPVKLGHEVVGVVEEIGPEGNETENVIKKGDIVVVSHHIPCYSYIYCDHGNYSMCRHFKETNLDPQGFSEYIRLSGEHIRYNTFVVEDNKNIKNVIFTEPTACCLRAVKRIDIKKNDNIMVVGCGTIGIIFISLFKLLYNTKVVAIDINSDKLKYAKKFGADLIINSKKENISEKLSEFSSSGVDVVVLTVTTPQTTEMAMDSVRPGGYIQIFAGPSTQHEISINFEHLYKKELTIFSSYSTTPEELKESFYFLKDYDLDFSSLISGILLGHEFSGEVVKIGRNIKSKIKVGDRIVCANTAPCGYCFYCRLGRESMCEDLIYLNGAYSQYITVQKRIVEKNTFIIPKNISFEEAALMEPLACVVHGIEESGIMMGDKVAINGAGPIGLMFVKLAGLKGAYIIVSDLSKDRLEVAKRMGARETIQIQKGINQIEEVKCRTEDGRGVDVAIDATGIPDVWEKTVKMVRKGGTANLFGGCSSGTTISIDTALIHYHEITIKGIYHHTPLYVKKAFELIINRIVDARQFITDTVPLDELIPTLEKVGRQEGIKYKVDVD